MTKAERMTMETNTERARRLERLAERAGDSHRATLYRNLADDAWAEVDWDTCRKA